MNVDRPASAQHHNRRGGEPESLAAIAARLAPKLRALGIDAKARTDRATNENDDDEGRRQSASGEAGQAWFSW